MPGGRAKRKGPPPPEPVEEEPVTPVFLVLPPPGTSTNGKRFLPVESESSDNMPTADEEEERYDDGGGDGEDEEDDDEEEQGLASSAATGAAASAREDGASTREARGGGQPRGELEALESELARTQREQESLAVELAAANAVLDNETHRADCAEEAVRTTRQRNENLECEAHRLRVQIRTDHEDEAMWREMSDRLTQQMEQQLAESASAASDSTRRKLEEKSQEGEEAELNSQRRRRRVADERCMCLRTALDFITGQLQIDATQLRLLLDDHDNAGDEAEAAAAAERIFQRQGKAHEQEMRGIVTAGNQEFRRRPVAGALLDEGLPRLLSMLVLEGVIDAQSCAAGRHLSVKRDPARAARLRAAVLGNSG